MRRFKPNFWVVVFLCLLCLGGVCLLSPLQAKDKKEDAIVTAPQKVEREWAISAPSTLRLNLEECLQRAYAYNGQLRALDYDRDIAHEKVGETKRIGRPVVEYEYTVAPVPRDVENAMESFFSGDLSVLNRFKLWVATPLTTFGKLKLAREMAYEGVNAAILKKETAKVKIGAKVRQLYYGILLAREFRHLLNGARKEVRKEIQKREEKGGTNPLELLKLKIFLSDLARKIEESDQKQILAKEAMAVQLGIDRSIRFDIKGTKLRPINKKLEDFKVYRSEARQGRADLKLLEVGHRVRTKQYSLAKREYAPNLGVAAFFEIGRAPGVDDREGLRDDYLDPFNFTRAGFGFQLKGKFDFFGQSAKIRQARAEVYKLEIQREFAEEGIILEVKKAYLDVKKSKADIRRADEAQKLSRQLLFLTQSNFDLGLADPKDLVEAISSFLQTRGEYFKAVFDFNVAVATLDEKLGHAPE